MWILIKQKDGGIEFIVGLYNQTESAIKAAIEIVDAERELFTEELEGVESSLRKTLAYGWVTYSEDSVVPCGEDHSVTLHWVESPTD